MTDAPSTIRCFETLQIVSIIAGLMNGFAVRLDHFVSSVVSAALLLTFTFLVSRGRKNWARWVLLTWGVLGVAFMAWGMPILLAEYSTTAVAIAIAVTLTNVAAVALLFTPASAQWLRATVSPA